MPLRQRLHSLNQRWLRYEYKHTALVLVSVFIFVALLQTTTLVTSIFEWLQQFGYISVFLAGLCMVSFFTVTPAVVLLVAMLNQGYDPLPVALVAGTASMIGDGLILLLFKERVFEELKPIFRRLKLDTFARHARQRYPAWAIFSLGAFLLMLPIPDEIGLALLGASSVKSSYVLAICLVLNIAGIYILALAAQAVVG